MPSSKEWTVQEVGELIAGVELLRSPGELSSALGRDEQEIKSKIAELGLTRKVQSSGKQKKVSANKTGTPACETR